MWLPSFPFTHQIESKEIWIIGLSHDCNRKLCAFFWNSSSSTELPHCVKINRNSSNEREHITLSGKSLWGNLKPKVFIPALKSKVLLHASLLIINFMWCRNLIQNIFWQKYASPCLFKCAFSFFGGNRAARVFIH